MSLSRYTHYSEVYCKSENKTYYLIDDLFIIRNTDGWINATDYCYIHDTTVEDFATHMGIHIRDKQIFKQDLFSPIRVRGIYINPRWFNYLQAFCNSK